MSNQSLGAVLLVVAVTGAAGTVAGGAAGGNRPPLAEAGLDQSVKRGATVYLDGSGSVDPDGTIRRYRWTIETPGGATITPDCQTCQVTQFRVNTTGRFAVTLTVTDSEGATRSDTMYVAVTEPVDPAVSLSGPDTALVGTEVTFSATAEGETAPLNRLVWLRNGSHYRTVDLDTPMTATESITLTFDEPGNYTVGTFVADTAGWTATTDHTVTVLSDSATSSGGDNDCTTFIGPHNVCQTGGADFTIQFGDDKLKVVDTNEKPGIQLYDNQKGEVVTYMSREELRRHNGVVSVETAEQNYKQKQKKDKNNDPDNGEGGSSEGIDITNDPNVCSGICGGENGGGNEGSSSGFGSGFRDDSNDSGGSSSSSGSSVGSSGEFGGYGGGGGGCLTCF